MQRLTYHLQRFCAAATGLLIILTAITAGLKSINYHQKKADLKATVASVEKNVPADAGELILANRDGKNPYSEDVKPYVEFLDKLEQKCQEPRVELAVIAGEMVKEEQKAGFEISNLEALETLWLSVESGFEKYPAECLQAYQYHVQSLKTMKQ